MTIESSPSLFGVSFMKLNGEITTYLIGQKHNDVDKIISTVKDNGILCGYNIRKLDSVILSYVINEPGSSANDIYEFTLSIKSCLSNGSYKNNEDYKNYISKTFRIGFVDLQRINDLKSDNILKTAISIGFKNVTGMDMEKNSMNASHKNELIEFIERKVKILREIYDASVSKLSIRKKLSNDYGEDFLCSTSASVASSILQKKYTAKTGTSSWDLYNNRKIYDHIELNDILPNHLVFRNVNILNLVKRLKDITLHSSDDKINETVATKAVVHNFKRGGLHSVSKPGIIEPEKNGKLLYLDFNTFYGKLIIQQDLRPDHVTERFTEVIDDLINLRIKLKNEGDASHEMIKRTIASISGNMSSKSSIFRDFKTAVKIYMYGQLTLLKVIDNLEIIDGVECIYSNTDGIILKVKEESLERLKNGLKYTEKEIGLPWETKFIDKLIYLDVNNYAIIDKDEFVGIGIFNDNIKLGDALSAPIISKAIKEYFINGVKTKDTVINGKLDINNYAISKSVAYNEIASYETINSRNSLSRDNRFYVSTSIGNIIYKKKTNHAWLSLIYGYQLGLLNKIEDKVYKDINFTYYIAQANSIIEKIDSKQLKLF